MKIIHSIKLGLVNRQFYFPIFFYQIATRALQIPIDKIHISDSASDKVPNATVTAGSSGSDLYGGAVQVS